jgi:VanZ family protein
VIAWFCVIAGLGGAGFGHDETSRFIGPLLRWLFPDWTNGERAQLHMWIRKTAHVVEYAVAAILIYRALWLTGRARSRAAAALPTLLLVAAVASSDEFRQHFLGGRTGAPWDVALDVGGGIAGLTLAPWIVPWLVARPRADADDDG